MSNTQQVFPTLQGLNWQYGLEPLWNNNVIKTTKTGLEIGTYYESYPKYEITLNYNFLTDSSFLISSQVVSNDLENIIGLYNIVHGNIDNFLYYDIKDNTETKQVFGIGDGVTKSFQLNRSFGGWSEPIYGLNGTPLIYVDNVQTTAFTVNNYGMVTFTNAPVAGKPLSWSGHYYLRCRFLDNKLTFQGLAKSLWDGGSIKLQTVKLRSS